MIGGLAISALALCAPAAQAGTWTAVANTAPNGVNLMLLLSDGTVMAQQGGATNVWYKLTPDIHGSYVNGTWSTLASMHDTRLYGSSGVMSDGRVFIAGGEYGSGGSTAEVYDPVANTWTMTPSSGQSFSDSVSTVLPNGNVLVGPVGPSVSGGTVIFSWVTNTWSAGPTYVRGGYQDEASWVKLPDSSVLTIDPFGQNSERYIPSQNRWVDDSVVPVAMYDTTLSEIGAAVLLPTGKAFFLGDTGHTALYTPTGNTNPGSWAAGPDIPNGLGTADAPAAMMVNGSVLCAVGPKATYNGPTTLCEYNPYTNAFTVIGGPTGATDNVAPYGVRMLDLPDGSVLYANGGSRLYTYRPSDPQIASARPTVTNVAHNVDGSYQLTGTLLTGISEGAEYGDDAQMASNYPIVRLTASNGNVYYARTYRWNDTGVMKTGVNQTTQFSVPGSVPAGSYSLQIVTNGIASDPIPFPVSEAYFMIVNQNSGKCLDLINGNMANGAVTNQWSYDYNGPNQRWALQPTENGDHFKLISWVSGKAVSVSNDSTGAGAQLWDWDYNGDSSQQWDLVDAGNGWYYIRNVRSGLVMDVSNSSTADNAMVQQWTPNQSGAQKWRLQPWGSYFIRAASGKYVCIQGAGSANGSPIIQYQQENNPWFKWQFTSEGDGFYGLFSLNAPSRVLCVVNGSSAAAANTHLWDYNVNNAGDQKIRIWPKTSGKFKFYFGHDNMSWDIPGGATGNNVNLQQYPDNGYPWQEFSLERTP
ncbi:hypothetical protein CCAX7_009080 [Capsulimonas corticalis]|uniref:Ricin B lectin domain-containing protein n=2 Tax=Capsulimonas corticalis TaxID=2219043 RepID=A0A9N7KZC8_9BACT|nr:hypothetical protein CCAX7_009080 [Capsulimonas corticalis]